MSPSVVMNIMYIRSTSFQGTFGMRAGGVGELILTFDTHTCHIYFEVQGSMQRGDSFPERLTPLCKLLWSALTSGPIGWPLLSKVSNWKTEGIVFHAICHALRQKQGVQLPVSASYSTLRTQNCAQLVFNRAPAPFNEHMLGHVDILV